MDGYGAWQGCFGPYGPSMVSFEHDELFHAHSHLNNYGYPYPGQPAASSSRAAARPRQQHRPAASSSRGAAHPRQQPVGAAYILNRAQDDASRVSDRDLEEQQRLEEALDQDVGLSHEDQDEQTFCNYIPSVFSSDVFQPHPDEIFETSSLSCLAPPKPTYQLRMCSQTIIRGLLTNAQLEAIALACAQHEMRLPVSGERSGFFLGDGPGVGKGRSAAGLIFENFLHGRRKALWFSVSTDLIADARRDLDEIGAGKVACCSLRTVPVTQKLQGVMQEGVYFSTYSLLVSSSSRIDQIVEWCGGTSFSGVIVFDEVHKAKNFGVGAEELACNRKPRFKRRKAADVCDSDDTDDVVKGIACSGRATKTALCVAELQQRLPLARILYVSATGASEAKHLLQLSRLGLWGPHTCFDSSDDFVKCIKRGGMGAMELVAMHLKASGQYLSRSLSFRSATFELINVEHSLAFRSQYDGAVALWLDMLQAVRGLPERPKLFMSRMWSAHQRFFASMILAAKVPHAVQMVENALSEGKCVVIGLQSTGEASGERAAAAAGGEGCAGQREKNAVSKDLFSSSDSQVESVILACRDQLGLPAAETDAWLRRLRELKLPPNPLDDLIWRLGGPDKVAEMTGRSYRYIKREKNGGRGGGGGEGDGMWVYVKRVKEGDELTLNIQERKAFMRGDKLVAVVSEAASSGISLHADKRAQNQRRRLHMTLQLPWAADQAVQQMGRSHRTNQASAPEFKLFMSSVGGELRFASAVASRLQSLGALTRGDRRAAGTGATIIQSFAIDSKYGRKAVSELMSIISHNAMVDGSAVPAEIRNLVAQGAAGVFDEFRSRALTAMRGVGLVDEDGEFASGTGAERVRNFLNRILGISLALQDEIFVFFSQLIEILIAHAKAKGEYVDGICDVAAANISLQSEQELFACPRTGATVVYCKLQSDRGVSFEEAQRLLRIQRDLYEEQLREDSERKKRQEMDKDATAQARGVRVLVDHSGFYIAKGRCAGADPVFFLAIKQKQKAGVRPMQFYHIIKPHTGHSAHVQHWNDFSTIGGGGVPSLVPDDSVVSRLKGDWEGLYQHSLHKCLHVRKSGARCPALHPHECDHGKRVKPIHLFTGLVLPFWRDLQRNLRGSIKVIRIQPSNGSRRLVGVHIVSSDDVEAAKDMFRRGIALAGEAHHKQKLAENPFYKVLATKQYHECLDPSGQDVVSFELPAGWDSTATGEPVLCTAQLFEIPYRNALETDDKTLRYPLAWKHPAQLSLLVKEPTSGREERRSVLTPLPPRAARGTSGPRMRPPVVLSDVSAGTNKVEVKSCGDRVAFVVQCVTERSAAEAAVLVLRSQRKESEWGRAILAKELGGDADVVVTDIPISLKCPYSFKRIVHPARGRHCEHFGCFDLQVYLEYCKAHHTWECPLCSKAVLPLDLWVCGFFEKILEAAEPWRERCNIDDKGVITCWGSSSHAQDDTDDENSSLADRNNGVATSSTCASEAEHERQVAGCAAASTTACTDDNVGADAGEGGGGGACGVSKSQTPGAEAGHVLGTVESFARGTVVAAEGVVDIDAGVRGEGDAPVSCRRVDEDHGPLARLERTGLWEYKEEAEDCFCEPPEEGQMHLHEPNHALCTSCLGRVSSERWIACDACSRWQHMVCAGVTHLLQVPHDYLCETCAPVLRTCARSVASASATSARASTAAAPAARMLNGVRPPRGNAKRGSKARIPTSRVWQDGKWVRRHEKATAASQAGAAKAAKAGHFVSAECTARADKNMEQADGDTAWRAIRVGDRVLGKYRDNQWYDATVEAISSSSRSRGERYTLQWSDGDVFDRIKSRDEVALSVREARHREQAQKRVDVHAASMNAAREATEEASKQEDEASVDRSAAPRKRHKGPTPTASQGTNGDKDMDVVVLTIEEEEEEMRKAREEGGTSLANTSMADASMADEMAAVHARRRALRSCMRAASLSPNQPRRLPALGPCPTARGRREGARHAAGGPQFSVGDAVMGRYARDGKLYAATIAKCEGSSFILAWADGDTEDCRKSASDLRLKAPALPNSQRDPPPCCTPSTSVKSVPARLQVGVCMPAQKNRDKSSKEIECLGEVRFRRGEVVEAWHRMGGWYEATIDKILADGLVEVTWADGDTTDRVKRRKKIRPILVPSPDPLSRVESRSIGP